MPINSKQKGKNGELEICNILKDYGYNVRRSVQYNGKVDEGQADITGLNYIHCEIKRVEKLNLENAMQQAKRDAKNTIPAVFHRKNNHKWLVTMELDDWIKLYNEYYSSLKLKEAEQC